MSNALGSCGFRTVLIAAAVLAPALCGAQPAVSVAGGGVRAEFDAAHGTLLRVSDAEQGGSVAAPDGQAENYRLTLQRPDGSAVALPGRDQKLTGVRREGGTLRLTWAGPLRDTAGAEHDVAVRMDVTAADGALTFGLHVENRSGLKLTEAAYPFVGGLSGFGGKGDARLWIPTSTPMERPIQPTAGGVTIGYPGGMTMAFTCVWSKAAGRMLSFAAHDPVARYKLFRFVETGAAPHTDLAATLQHMPMLPSGRSFDGAPVVVRFGAGGWEQAAQAYRRWFVSSFGVAGPENDWIRRQSFFLMTMFLLPEGTLNYTFKDIPRWALAAKRCGLGAVQISGWQRGGHDNGYPYYEPDPRLGTWKDLEAGIRACHRLGLKVYFFANYQPMMVDTNWYKTELHKYREMNPSGGLTWLAGWGMGTLWARAGHPRLMTWADLAFPEFRKIIVDYFVKLASIGADGVHVDKMFPSAIEYNPASPLPPDTATWEGAILLSREVMAACRKVNPNWCMSFECNWDRMLQFGAATWWVGNQLVTRKVFPENVETLGLYQSYDYLGVNNAVRDGHAVMVAPLNFCRGVDWPPFRDLAAYIRDVKRIRDHLADTVFWGEVLGPASGVLEGATPDGVAINVFRNRTTGRRACILTNSRMQARIVTFAGFGDDAGEIVRVYEPGKRPRTRQAPFALTIPAERIAFVEEVSEGAAAAASAARPASLRSPAPGGARSVRALPTNGGFETGDFTGWVADPNWVVVDNSCGYYSGWEGRYWAWSGGKGEAAMGVLRSKPFVMNRDAVRLLISGWGSIQGTGRPRHWNYVALKTEDGTEVDRVWAPDTTVFVPAYLDGSKVRGRPVYIEAVDDADQATYSMLCIDDVRVTDLPADYVRPVRTPSAFDPALTLRLEDASLAIDVSRSNGSVTRIRDKRSGLDLILEPRLAGSYRFALPLPGHEPWQTIDANWIFGRDQQLTSHTLEGNRLTLRWAGPLRNYLGEAYPVSATVTIELRGGGALFRLTVENASAYSVGETYFPVLGGLQGLGATIGALKATEMVRPIGSRTAESPAFASSTVFRSFANQSPFGDQGPEQFYSCPDAQPAPWLGFCAPKLGRSVLVAACDPADRPLFMRLELKPASSGTPRDDGNWPRPSELKGKPEGVELSFVDTRGGAAGARYEAAPVFLRFLDGGGPELMAAYRGRPLVDAR